MAPRTSVVKSSKSLPTQIGELLVKVGVAGGGKIFTSISARSLSQPSIVCETKYDIVPEFEASGVGAVASGVCVKLSLYHCKSTPVADNVSIVLPTHAESGEITVGGAVSLVVTVTSARSLSQASTVCDTKYEIVPEFETSGVGALASGVCVILSLYHCKSTPIAESGVITSPTHAEIGDITVGGAVSLVVTAISARSLSHPPTVCDTKYEIVPEFETSGVGAVASGVVVVLSLYHCKSTPVAKSGVITSPTQAEIGETTVGGFASVVITLISARSLSQPSSVCVTKYDIVPSSVVEGVILACAVPFVAVVYHFNVVPVAESGVGVSLMQ